MISAALCLMGVCGLLAWCLARLGHIDALTAYLATSPGGLDSVAIIAASTPRVDLPFVMALQSVRLVFAIGLAPLITQFVVRHSPHLQNVRNRLLKALVYGLPLIDLWSIQECRSRSSHPRGEHQENRVLIDYHP